MKTCLKFICAIVFPIALLCSCSTEESKPPVEPKLTVTPTTSILFSAEAVESFEISVSTNQSSWDVISSQSWCKVVKNGASFIVTADPNLQTTSPTPAIITVSAGAAKSVKLDVAQVGLVSTYPKNEEELVKALTHVWIFPEASNYISLELGSNNTFTLLSKTPIAKSSENLYSLIGKYEISDLHKISLSGFGTITITNITANEIEITISPSEGTSESIKPQRQQFADLPKYEGKKIKSLVVEDASFNFFYTENKLTKVRADAVDYDTQEPYSVDINYTYENDKVLFSIDGKAFDKPGVFEVQYNLNSAGLAISSIVTNSEEGLLYTNYYTYSNVGELISLRREDAKGRVIEYCNAVWWSGENVISASVSELHLCDDEYTMEGDMKLYHHDHNADGHFDNNDKLLFNGKFVESKYPYIYSEDDCKSNFISPDIMPIIFQTTEFDAFAQWAGILGVSIKKLPINVNSRDISYSFDAEGYPTKINVTVPDYPDENYYSTLTYYE